MSDTLYELIHTLTKSEKRYFKLVAGREGGRKQQRYMDLFDTLVRINEFDEKRIQAVMQWDNYKSSYSMAKQYLYGKILKSLADFEKKDTVVKRLGEECTQIRTLIRKGLLQQAGRKITKAKRLAYKVEALVELLSLLRLEQKVVVADKERIAKRDELLQLGNEIRKTVAGIELKEAIRNIHYHFFSILRLKGGIGQKEQMDELDQLCKELDQLNPLANSFFYPRMLYHNVLNQNLYLKGDFKGSLESLSQIQNLFENQPAFQKEFALEYLSTLHNLCNRGFMVKDYACCLEALEKIRTFPNLNVELLGRWTESFYTMGILLIIHSGSLAENGAFTQAVVVLLGNPKRKLSLGFVMELNRCLMVGYVMEGEFEKAIRQIQLLIQDVSYKSMRSFRRLLPVVELLVHCDLGNYDWLEQRLESMLKHHAPEKAFRFEEMLLRFLRAFIQCTSAEAKQRMADVFLVELTGLRKLPNETPVFAFFDFEAWVKAKVKGSSMGDIVRSDWAVEGYPTVVLKLY